MKLVVQQGSLSKSFTIEEIALETTINQIKLFYGGTELTPQKYELFRYKSRDQLFVIYKNNRTLRSKNSWYEIRALTALSEFTGNHYLHSKILRDNNGLETEIDGLDQDSEKIMIEVKRIEINQDWIDYYSKKAQKFKMHECVVIAPKYDGGLSIPNNVSPFVFHADVEAVETYYKEKYQLPELFEPHIQRRHIRVLLQNGKWQGVNRVISQTAKHSYTSKFRAVFSNIIKQNKTPIRVYYSLAPMVRPVAEYFGNGYPFTKMLAGLDVDADHSGHLYNKLGYCYQCKSESEIKAKKLSKKLGEMGYNYLRYYSGSKGFHFYLLENDKILELPLSDFSAIISKLVDENNQPIVDNVNFLDGKGRIDSHRIFKLPNSIDAGTGIFVRKKFEQLRFEDKLFPLY